MQFKEEVTLKWIQATTGEEKFNIYSNIFYIFQLCIIFMMKQKADTIV